MPALHADPGLDAQHGAAVVSQLGDPRARDARQRGAVRRYQKRWDHYPDAVRGAFTVEDFVYKLVVLCAWQLRQWDGPLLSLPVESLPRQKKKPWRWMAQQNQS